MTDRNDKYPIRLGITLGDPAGVGPEIVLKTLNDDLPDDLDILLFGNPYVLLDHADFLGIKIQVQNEQNGTQLVLNERTYSILDPTGWKDKLIFPGKPDKMLARGILRCLDNSVMFAREESIDGIVTAPLSKEIIRNGGFPEFTGHTEYLGYLTETKRQVMMLASPDLRVVLATTHIPFNRVVSVLKEVDISEILSITHSWFQEYYHRNPIIAMAALNPHGGEGGTLGHEEKTILIPAITKAVETGLDIRGPFPADTVFRRCLKGEWDVVLALYHDQGMIPVKLDLTNNAVNVTLGLPIIRTSPDHGTAYDIAGKGVADPASFKYALLYARELVRRKKKIE